MASLHHHHASIRCMTETLLGILIEKDHLGDWSPQKDCCLWVPFQQPVLKPSSESRLWRWLPHLIDFSNQGMLLPGSNHFLICWAWYNNLNHRKQYCYISKFQALLDVTYVVECQLVNEEFPEDRSAKEIKHLIGKFFLILIFQSGIKMLVGYISALMNFVLLEILFQVNLLLLLVFLLSIYFCHWMMLYWNGPRHVERAWTTYFVHF